MATDAGSKGAELEGRLLKRFLPALRYDSQEGFFADSAAEWTDNPSNVLRRAAASAGAKPEPIAAADAGPGEQALSLDYLGTYEYRDGDHIANLRPNYRTQYVALRKHNPEYRNRIYGRVARGPEGAAWLQYWFFYFYNDYRMAGGAGLHEGDWEMVQLRMPTRELHAADMPEEAVYAQHKHAERAPWSQVEKLEGSDRPVVYVGRGSHASYFEKGLHETEAWLDIADGKRKPSALHLDPIPDQTPGWLGWRGRWGDTEPTDFWLLRDIEQPSPTGPCVHGQWKHPDRLLKDARLLEPPSDPTIPRGLKARRTADHLTVDYDLSGGSGDPPRQLIATVNSSDEPEVSPKTFSFDLKGARRGTLRTGVPLDSAKSYDVRLSLIGADGVPSGSHLEIVNSSSGGDPAGLRLLRRVGAFFYRLLYRRET